MTNTGPISMSFPAVLHAQKIADRFTDFRLRGHRMKPTSDAIRVAVKKNKRKGREGKRWIRRKENCTLRWLNLIA